GDVVLAQRPLADVVARAGHVVVVHRPILGVGGDARRRWRFIVPLLRRLGGGEGEPPREERHGPREAAVAPRSSSFRSPGPARRRFGLFLQETDPSAVWWTVSAACAAAEWTANPPRTGGWVVANCRTGVKWS